MAGIKCDSCDRKQLVKVNVLRKRVNIFRMDHGSHKSQITVIETETETETVSLK